MSQKSISSKTDDKIIKNDSFKHIIKKDSFLLKNSFELLLPDNISTSKVPCSSGGSVSIKLFKKFIISGFTNPNIFLKWGRKDKKVYYLSFIIDLSKSIVLEFNYSHVISNILLLLLAPSILDNNENIFIDLIINTINGIRIVDLNTKCSDFQKYDKIMEIFRIIHNSLNLSCCPGSCLYTSYQILLEKRDEKKIFIITDGYITNKYEIELAEKIISNCQIEGINLTAIGVGQFPYGIDKIFPNCCYSPNINMLSKALFGYFHNRSYSSSDDNITEKCVKDNKFIFASL